jgi:hypothetical protein
MTNEFFSKASIGVAGTTVSLGIWIRDANMIVGFIVGLMTLIYISLQTFYLLKNKGKNN